MPLWLLAAEVFATILGLFLFGSFRYQIHKNALTYGMLIVVVATFSQLAASSWHAEIATSGWLAWASHHLLSFEGLDGLIHADTMLFILGLTLFVSVVAQTRLLEGITFALLRRYQGFILPTVISVMTPVELIEGHAGLLDGKAERIIERLRAGESLGLALVDEDVEVETRRLLFGHFVSEDLADGLDRHYLYDAAGREEEAMQAEQTARVVLASAAKDRHRAQVIGALGLVPFIALLVTHGVNHTFPLFPSSFTAFAVAILGIMHLPKMRRLALQEARAEYAEYYFLFPLFLSISLCVHPARCRRRLHAVAVDTGHHWSDPADHGGDGRDHLPGRRHPELVVGPAVDSRWPPQAAPVRPQPEHHALRSAQPRQDRLLVGEDLPLVCQELLLVLLNRLLVGEDLGLVRHHLPLIRERRCGHGPLLRRNVTPEPELTESTEKRIHHRGTEPNRVSDPFWRSKPSVRLRSSVSLW